MEKKARSMDKGGRRQHRHSYGRNAHGGFPTFSNYSRRFSGDKSASWINLEAPLHLSKITTQWESANKNEGCAKFVVNVSIAQSIGHLLLFVSNETTVADVIKATLDLYAKDGRSPSLGSDPLSFRLHYSQFTFDYLDYNDKMEDLARRNFYLCPNTSKPITGCGTELEKIGE
ncbi:hypothetical protein SUGI_0978050 [Cryptomeria japonica]|nr:hypothetical protein SUGI_0978050 [Cryptomeria japonica]